MFMMRILQALYYGDHAITMWATHGLGFTVLVGGLLALIYLMKALQRIRRR